VEAKVDDGIHNGLETDIDCGGPQAPPCAVGKACLRDSDCDGRCNYAGRCIDTPSCVVHFGGDTCGKGEVTDAFASHESCCRTLRVADYEDPRHPGEDVYLDKYEITAGRIRAFVSDIASKAGGIADIRGWIMQHPPPIWESYWNAFLPSSNLADTVRIDRILLGDRRPDVIDAPIPADDQSMNVAIDYQFNAQSFVYIHGGNCATRIDAYGFPTFFYPAATMALYGQDFPPRADGKTTFGAKLPAQESLDTKAMNCITNVMLAAFCHWDGGQLATDEVLDFVTDSPSYLGDAPGCGTQTGDENPPTTAAATQGGRCADLAQINATFDAGALLPKPGSPLNDNHYMFPWFADGTSHDKSWQVSAPGRGSLATNGEPIDTVRIHPEDEPWMDLAGNLNEVVFKTQGTYVTKLFGLKFRGLGYQSARSELNIRTDWPGENGLRRIERPEAKAAFAGGRCMRFRPRATKPKP